MMTVIRGIISPIISSISQSKNTLCDNIMQWYKYMIALTKEIKGVYFYALTGNELLFQPMVPIDF